MKSYKLVLFGVVLASLFSCIQCSKCTSEVSNKADETSLGESLKNGDVQNGSAQLEWEQISLGASKTEFKSAAAVLLQQKLSEIEDLFQCGILQGAWVISPLKNSLVEHTSKGKLSWCQISSFNIETSGRISSVRGEFLENILVQLQFKFVASQYDILQEELESRFGKGEIRKLTEETVTGKHMNSFLLWKVNGITWGLKKGNPETTLIVQNARKLMSLPIATDSEGKGAPAKTDLSDIGISGSPYDVNLDDIADPPANDTAADNAADSDSDV
ncbi:MAG: hypothetical protein JXR76_28520 [Deltaproteobacteria bacterium]|nr:hypothetical protein [Deltaproteobacteria bacterium]